MIYDNRTRGAHFLAFLASNASLRLDFLGYLGKSAKYLLQRAEWADKIMEHFWLISKSNENGYDHPERKDRQVAMQQFF